MRTKTSVSQEDYLKAIWELLEEGQPPISARLAEELSVTPPAVTAALKQEGKSLEFLANLLPHPAPHLPVARREYDETLPLRSSNRTLHLGKPATSRIWVRRLSA